MYKILSLGLSIFVLLSTTAYGGSERDSILAKEQAIVKNSDDVSESERFNALLDLYRTQPEVGILLELMTDFDEGMQEWRYRHVKMVQRTIGTRKGTGGSSGAEYLKTTLFHPVFPDLWEIRTEF